MSNKIFACVIFVLSLFGQFSAQTKSEIDVRNLKTDEFPLVKGDLWIRDPNGISTGDIQFFEDDKEVDLKFGGIKKSDSLSDNKAIVFLVLNGHSQNELNWYKEVLKKTINGNSIKDGDKIEIISFCCKDRDGLIFPSKITFTSNKEEMLARIDAISFQKNQVNCSNKSQLHLAINDALGSIEAETTNLPTAIFVLSDNAGMKLEFAGETPGPRARRLYIPIYGIAYSKNLKDNYGIKELCEQTYGTFYQNGNNDIDDICTNLNTSIEELINRNGGIYYSFAYTSSFEKDGKTHSVKINTKSNGQSAFALLTPNKNLIEWIQDNLILSLVLFVLFIGLLVVIIQQSKKNKLKKIELEEKRKSELLEIEKVQQESESKILEQKRQLELLKQEELRKSQKQESEIKSKEQIEEDAKQFKKMLEKGNLPWFVYGLGSEGGNFQIQSCKLNVGRDDTNDWVLHHPSISKKHFKLTFKDYIYQIEDLNSTNGVFVNGNKIEKLQLKHGDLVKIGDISLTFYI